MVTNDRRPDGLPDPLLRAAARDEGGGLPGETCLDADSLAAWADRTLPGRDVEAVEAHAAGCSRCRALMAAMVRTEPPRGAAVAWWRAPIVRWAAPLAAAAGGLLIWVTVDRQPDSVMIDAVRPPAAASVAEPPAASAAPAEPPKQVEIAESEQRAASKPAAREAAPVLQDKRRAAAAAPAAAPPAQQDTFAAAARSMSEAVTVDVVSPDPSSRWRIAGPGQVDRSTDGGQTWQRQTLGVDVRLVSGASPAPRVCWMVGAAGAVWRTTDGSAWERLAPPDPGDLLRVTATDAATATVTTVDGRAFTTSDGGKTWSGAPLQENPPAPFQA